MIDFAGAVVVTGANVVTIGVVVVTGANVVTAGVVVVTGANVVTAGVVVATGAFGLTVVVELRAIMHERFPLHSWYAAELPLAIVAGAIVVVGAPTEDDELPLNLKVPIV